MINILLFIIDLWYILPDTYIEKGYVPVRYIFYYYYSFVCNILLFLKYDQFIIVCLASLKTISNLSFNNTISSNSESDHPSIFSFSKIINHELTLIS